MQVQNIHYQDYYDYLNDNPKNLINSLDYVGDNEKYNNFLLTKTSFIIELDDDKDLDILKNLLDPFLPSNIVLLNSEFDIFNSTQS